MSRARALLAWSSGKDSAWALHVLRSSPTVEVLGLLTTLNRVHDRVAMHAVRRELVQAQAASAGLPLWIVEIPPTCSDEAYAAAMGAAMARARASGIDAIAFGDLFLEDVRRYRERQLDGTGIAPLFPLWGRPTAMLAEEMLAAGVRAIVTCADPRAIPGHIAGCTFDRALLAALPRHVDPCGENGEFHTFAWDGPMFRAPVRVRPGEIVARDGYVFADLLPEEQA
jgi:uncharacterized protein (TIGR00290 family)